MIVPNKIVSVSSKNCEQSEASFEENVEKFTSTTNLVITGWQATNRLKHSRATLNRGHRPLSPPFGKIAINHTINKAFNTPQNTNKYNKRKAVKPYLSLINKLQTLINSYPVKEPLIYTILPP